MAHDNSLWVFKCTQPIQNFYSFGKQLGQPGQFGVACLVTEKSTGHIFACKCLSKQRLIDENHRDVHMALMRNEIDIMKRLSAFQNPNVISFKEFFEDQNYLYLVMECATGGELFDRIQARVRYSELDAQIVVKQMLQAVQFLHKLDVVHADIKPDNFLFADPSEHAPIKMIDFGQSQRIRPRQLLHNIAGTPFYMAPEMVCQNYNKASDVWSVGVVMYVLLYGYPPFYSKEDKGIYQLIRRGFVPVTRDGYGPWFKADIRVSDAAKDLIAKLLKSDVAERLTAEEALEHPWLVHDADATPIDESVLQSLKEFSANCRFKQIVCKLMAHDLSEESLKKYQENFALIDANHDGMLTKEEFAVALAKMPNYQVMVEAVGGIDSLMHNLDVNGDGVVSYEEWMVFLVNRHLSMKEERLHLAFRKFDLDGDGKITPQEVSIALHDENAEHVQSLIAEVDHNQDGTIDYEEFLSMWSKYNAVGRHGSSEMKMPE